MTKVFGSDLTTNAFLKFSPFGSVYSFVEDNRGLWAILWCGHETNSIIKSSISRDKELYLLNRSEVNSHREHNGHGKEARG